MNTQSPDVTGNVHVDTDALDVAAGDQDTMIGH